MFNLRIGQLLLQLGASTAKLEKDLSGAESLMMNTSRRMTTIGRRLTTTLTTTLGAVGAIGTRTFASFDDEMTKSTAIMSNVSEALRNQMEMTARTVALDSRKSADQLAASYYYLASAGMSAEQSISSLSVVERFGVAGTFDLALATDLLTDAQSALGLSTKNVTQNEQNLIRVSDVLVKANTLANASVEQFSRSLTSKAGSALRLVNKDIEEGVAVLAAYADQGWKAERSGEALNIILRDLQTASIRNAEAWDMLGVGVYDATGQMKPLADIIEDLEKLFGQLSDRQMRVASQLLGFQDRSFSALATLVGTSGRIREYEKALRDAGGTTENVAEKQMSSFTSQMITTWRAIQDVAMDIGSILAPRIIRLGNIIKGATAVWRDLNNETKTFIVNVGVVVASLGPALLIFGQLAALLSSKGLIIGGIRMLVAALSSLYSGLIAVGTAAVATFGWWLVPILAIVAAIAALVYEIVGPEGLVNAWESAKNAVINFFKGTLGFFANFRHNMAALIEWVSNSWREIFVDIGEMLTVAIINYIYNWKIAIKTVVALFYAFGDWMVTLISKIFTFNVIEAMDKSVQWMRTAFFDLFRQIGSWFKRILSGADIDEAELSKKLGDAVRRGVGEVNFFKTTADIMKTAMDEMRSPLEGFESSLKNLPDLILDIKAPKQVTNSLDEASKTTENTLRMIQPELTGLGALPQAMEMGDNLSNIMRGQEAAQTEIADEGAFREINLRRFSLEGLQGFGLPQKQQVEAKGIESRLDTLIQIAQNKTEWALT